MLGCSVGCLHCGTSQPVIDGTTQTFLWKLLGYNQRNVSFIKYPHGHEKALSGFLQVACAAQGNLFVLGYLRKKGGEAHHSEIFSFRGQLGNELG